MKSSKQSCLNPAPKLLPKDCLGVLCVSRITPFNLICCLIRLVDLSLKSHVSRSADRQLLRHNQDTCRRALFYVFCLLQAFTLVNSIIIVTRFDYCNSFLARPPVASTGTDKIQLLLKCGLGVDYRERKRQRSDHVQTISP